MIGNYKIFEVYPFHQYLDTALFLFERICILKVQLTFLLIKIIPFCKKFQVF